MQLQESLPRQNYLYISISLSIHLADFFFVSAFAVGRLELADQRFALLYGVQQLREDALNGKIAQSTNGIGQENKARKTSPRELGGVHLCCLMFVSTLISKTSRQNHTVLKKKRGGG